MAMLATAGLRKVSDLVVEPLYRCCKGRQDTVALRPGQGLRVSKKTGDRGIDQTQIQEWSLVIK